MPVVNPRLKPPQCPDSSFQLVYFVSMTTALAIILASTPNEALKLTFVPSGISTKMGYAPQRAALSDKVEGIKRAPNGLTSPRYGTITLLGRNYVFVLDETDSGSKLWVDTNADGDLTNDPATKWEVQKRGEFSITIGTAEVMIGSEKATLGVYKFDPKDPQRAQLKDTLLWYTDFGYEGTGKFGNQTFPVLIAGPIDSTSRIWVDRNSNGKADGRSEFVSAATPFNFGGTTYELKAQKNTFDITESEKAVAEIPLPPDLSVGQDVPKFQAVSMDGSKISFPETFKGKIVMLDFWATWCGPCVAELPNVIKAYEKYHSKGFEVLGISFDKEDMADKVTAFTKEHTMPWKQIYEGKFWSTTLGTQFGVEAIPFCLLVDGSTGKILATVDKLRGEQLDKTLEGILVTRH